MASAAHAAASGSNSVIDRPTTSATPKATKPEFYSLQNYVPPQAPRLASAEKKEREIAEAIKRNKAQREQNVLDLQRRRIEERDERRKRKHEKTVAKEKA